MTNFMERKTGKGPATVGRRRLAKGFSTTEVITTVGLVAVLIGLAIPSYRDAVEKRQITQGAELIVAFINSVQSESIKRNRMVAVSYASEPGGSWCIGAVVGQSPCDCNETDPAHTNYCALEGSPWVLRDGDVATKDLIRSVGGDGAYVFDPVRGLFTDSTDVLSLGLGAADGQYQMNLQVVATGKVSICLPDVSEGIQGFHSCPQEL